MSIPRPEYPRPQFVRADWLNLNGTWQFEADYGDSGIERGVKDRALTGTITVPARALQSVGVRAILPWKVAAETTTFALEVSNLADVRAASYAGVTGPVREPIGDLYEYPLPGRAFMATLRVARE